LTGHSQVFITDNVNICAFYFVLLFTFSEPCSPIEYQVAEPYTALTVWYDRRV